MNNYQLHRLLKRHYHTSDAFKSCLTADAAPSVITDYPSFFIINQSTSQEIHGGNRGTHWAVLAFIDERSNAEFFDSRNLGLETYASAVTRSLQLNGNGKITTNAVAYQDANSSACGEFCCWFIDMRCMSVPFDKCMQLLSAHDLKQNEYKIRSYVTRHMNQI